MKYFQRALEIIRTDGIHIQRTGGERQLYAPMDINPNLFDSLEKVMPFVFSDNIEIRCTPDEYRNYDKALNPPFNCFSLEKEHESVFRFTAYDTDNSPDAIESFNYRCLIVILDKNVTSSSLLIGLRSFDEDMIKIRAESMNLSACKHIGLMLEQIPSMTMGEEVVNKCIKIGKGKSQRYATYKKIIHICPKKLRTSYEKGDTPRHIDWKYKFPVRGHWRHVKGFGRDAQGGEAMGRTWVKHYVKGAKDLPLAIKERHVSK